MANLSEEDVSNYLRDHPRFLMRWLSDNATSELLDFLARLLRDRNQDTSPDVRPSCSYLRTASLASSRPGRVPSFTQSARNSITSSIFRRYVDGEHSRKASVRRDRKSLCHMSEEELFMELIRDISSELDVSLLCHKILQNVSILTNSDRGSLFLVRGSHDNKYLVSKLFDVTVNSTLEDSVHTQANEIRVPFGKGIVGIVAQTGLPVNIKDAYADPRFNQEIDRQTGYKTHSILSMPIANYEGEVIGVAQIINKIDGDHEFTKQDEELFRKYLIFCGIGITNAQLFEMSVNEFKRNQLLLHLARGIFEEQTNLEKLVQKIMLESQDLLKCEKCSVYLLEDTLEHDPASQRDLKIGPLLLPAEFRPRRRDISDVVFSKGFDMWSKDGTVTATSGLELLGSRTAFIAKFAVVSDETVNVPDVEADGRFGKGPFTDSRGFLIRSALCMPIHNSEKRIIGVTQLINKINGEAFNDNDVNIIEAFSIFTGLGIHNCQMYENACQLMAKQSVALEVLSYHATAQSEESSELARAKIPTAEDLRLYTFDFSDVEMNDDITLKACMRMFLEADLINRFKVPYEVACRWVCTVKKNYRPVTYHNWRHAFNVCQSMFNILFTGGLRRMFDDLEVFSLLAACLCHDLDHRGTNNAFQVKVASPLAMLYSTSVLEHHHFDQCIMILNSEGNNIFQSLSPEEYRRAVRILEHAILSTDLALYFKKRGDFKKLVETGERQFKDPSRRELLRAMMMTACDVAAITKPWLVQQRVAQLVTNEFFEQGDIERTQLGEQPIPMMDRDKKDELPKMQVGFIDAICIPIYKLFADMTEKLAPLYTGCESNRQKWQELAEQAASPVPTETEQNDEKQPTADDRLEPPIHSSNDNSNSNVSNSLDSVNAKPATHSTAANLPATDGRDPSSAAATCVKPDSHLVPVPSPSVSTSADAEVTAPPSAHRSPLPAADDVGPCGDPPAVASPCGDPPAVASPSAARSAPPRTSPSDRPRPPPPLKQQQNGSAPSPKLTTEDVPADIEKFAPPSNSAEQYTKRPHGKRKTYAQAHACASSDKGNTNKSGLCLVS